MPLQWPLLADVVLEVEVVEVEMVTVMVEV